MVHKHNWQSTGRLHLKGEMVDIEMCKKCQRVRYLPYPPKSFSDLSDEMKKEISMLSKQLSGQDEKQSSIGDFVD